MSLTLFRSYVFLIVLCIFMILVDNTRSRDVPIPSGCKIYLATDNKIVLPQQFEVKPPEGFRGTFPKDCLKETPEGSIVNLPQGWSIVLPEGFKVIIPDTISVPPRGWFDNSPRNCKMTIYNGWTVLPSDIWKNITIGDGPEVLFDITVGDEKNSVEIAVEAVVHKCTMFLPKNNKVILPKGFTINPPKLFRGAFPTNCLKETPEGSIVNLPDGWSVSLPDGFTVGPPQNWKGVPVTGWIEENPHGSHLTLPEGWIIKPTTEFKNNNNDGGSIEIFKE